MQAVRSNLLRYADDQCGICREDYSTDSDCLALRCGHLFHRMCIQAYFDTKLEPKCPLCQSRVTYISKETIRLGAKNACILFALWIAFMLFIRSRFDTCAAPYYDTCPSWGSEDLDMSAVTYDDDLELIKVIALMGGVIFLCNIGELYIEKWLSWSEVPIEINYKPSQQNDH